MIPTIGRIVHYKLNTFDVAAISAARGTAADKNSCRGNSVTEGDVYPAMIVKTWGGGEGSAVNLQVFLDGSDSLWATSRSEGAGEGQWMPPQVNPPAPPARVIDVAAGDSAHAAAK